MGLGIGSRPCWKRNCGVNKKKLGICRSVSLLDSRLQGVPEVVQFRAGPKDMEYVNVSLPTPPAHQGVPGKFFASRDGVRYHLIRILKLY